MDIDETAWASIRPNSDGSITGTLMEVYSRQVPVQYITAKAEETSVKIFLAMLQEAVDEDDYELIRSLENLLRHNAQVHMNGEA
ncbi:unnamed protein product [Phytophthora lilii]|uniref:Unnamed protein product n=1 Tax=Phytophthora lilii TaxID=2077276 RepID=A0A9W6U1W8_9STRA|nr:unnamed protein product [Phytophthora lilii]